MRYAFHGKVRATGERVDGYVEAANSTEAFDKLADQGIIGVHTVRPDPEPKPAQSLLPNQPATPPGPSAEVVMVQLVEKMNTLIGHVEKLLSRPATVITAPARGDGGSRSKRIVQKGDAAQDEALRAIFQTNMELRRSIQKLDALTAAGPSGSGPSGGPTAPSMNKPAPAHLGETRKSASLPPLPPMASRSREAAVQAQPAA